MANAIWLGVARVKDGAVRVEDPIYLRTRAEAQRTQDQLRQRLGGQPFIVEEP